jgi:glutathione synthase/RimK-type ligase-like ATP-grasp enzyme
MSKLPKIGLLYMDYVLRFFDKSNFKGWPDKIEVVTYHWKNDKARFINEVRRKNIDVLVGNIPATAYETFKEIAKSLPNVRFIPSIETQFANKSKENVTLFCEKYNIQAPKTKITYDKKEQDDYLKNCSYPQIIKRSYGPSNYGGYYVHKVDDYQEAKALMDEKQYAPFYSQNAVPLKDSGDIRVMLIGHKPICAFWRYSGAGEWITNTSQGGSMSYDNVPMNVLELAVKASKAAKAEYWACDIAIDENTNEPYILECATAFAAFPYVRDWICQYIMWDLSGGKFRLPHVPLYSWEELGKMDSSVLRTLRHLYFSKYEPSADGAYWLADKGNFNMELTDDSKPSDVPEPIRRAEDLPQTIKDAIDENIEDELEDGLLNFSKVTLTELLSLNGMDEEIAQTIIEFRDNETITNFLDLDAYDFVSDTQLSSWSKNFK